MLASVLWVVMGTIGVVMLMACMNVANVLLVKRETRPPGACHSGSTWCGDEADRTGVAPRKFCYSDSSAVRSEWGCL